MYLILIYTMIFLGSLVKKSKKIEVIIEKIYFLGFWIFASTSMNGKDRLSYEGIFNSIDANNIKLIFSQKVVEKGYYLLNLIVKNFSNNFVIFLIFITFITTILNFKAFKYFKVKFNLKLETILLIYLPTVYISGQMGALRQSIAISIFIFSFKYIFERNYIKYIVYIGIASLFHKSSLILLILPFIYYFKSKKRIKIIIFVHLSIFMLLIFLQRSGMIYHLGKLSLYVRGISYGIMGSIERMLFLVLVLIRYKKKTISEEEKILLELYLLYLAQVFAFDSFFTMMYRIRMYYFSIFSILFPLLLKNMTIKNVNIVKLILYIYGILIGIMFMKSVEVKNYFIPYRNYFIESHTLKEVEKIKGVEKTYNTIFMLK